MMKKFKELESIIYEYAWLGEEILTYYVHEFIRELSDEEYEKMFLGRKL